jgi:hypothetical protein
VRTFVRGEANAGYPPLSFDDFIGNWFSLINTGRRASSRLARRSTITSSVSPRLRSCRHGDFFNGLTMPPLNRAGHEIRQSKKKPQR